MTPARPRPLGGLCAAAVAAALASAPAAGAAQQGATRFLRQRHERVNRVLHEEASPRRTERLTALLRELLDYEELSRRALASHWEERSEEERARFVSLLRQLVERNYEDNLERILEFDVRYLREARSNGSTIVFTEARARANRRQPPVEIAYTMRRVGRRWRVYDVTTDGVSMVENYRRQFHRIIRRDGWGELIQRMERRLARGGGD